MENKAQQEAEEKNNQLWLSIEKNRKAREIYQTKEISGWSYTGVVLGMLMAGIALLLKWGGGLHDNTFMLVGGIGMAPLLALSFCTGLEKEWKASLWAKNEIKKQGSDNNTDFQYKSGYLYTDKPTSYWLYMFAKALAVLATIAFGLGVAILLFIWLGTISIAPTTIIIILLVMILLK